MPTAAPVYDLMLLLSTGADEARRTQILEEVQSAISDQGGSITRNDDWGTRGMTYRIDHQADAEYHLLQFSGPPSLLESLSHSLRIADDVLRFRIIKLIPGMPEAPSSPPPVVASVGAAGARAGAGAGAGTATAEREDPGDDRAAPGPPAEVPTQPATEAQTEPAAGDAQASPVTASLPEEQRDSPGEEHAAEEHAAEEHEPTAEEPTADAEEPTAEEPAADKPPAEGQSN